MLEDGWMRGWVGCRAACWLGFTEGGEDEKCRGGRDGMGREEKEEEVDVELGHKGDLACFAQEMAPFDREQGIG